MNNSPTFQHVNAMHTAYIFISTHTHAEQVNTVCLNNNNLVAHYMSLYYRIPYDFDSFALSLSLFPMFLRFFEPWLLIPVCTVLCPIKINLNERLSGKHRSQK